MKISKKRRLDKARYKRHRKEVVVALGGKCVVCGSNRRLEIDHIDPTQKKFEVLACMRSVTPEELAAEIAKCQLLCRKDHMAKSLKERGQVSARGQHGSLSSYRYCHCTLCTKAHSDYCAAYNKKKREAKRAAQAQRAIDEESVS